MKIQISTRYETEEKEMTRQDLVNLVRSKFSRDFSVLSFRIDLESGVNSFFSENVTIKILSDG